MTDAAVIEPETPEPDAIVGVDDDDAFGDAFDEFNGPSDPAPADPDPEPEPEPAPVVAAVPETPAPATDIWADATPEQKAAYETASADAHRWSSDQGRAAKDARRITDLENQIINRPAPEADTAVPSSLESIYESDDWKTLEEELPETAGPIRALMEHNQTELDALKAQIAPISDDRVTAAEDAQTEIVATVHPDWQAVTGDPEFMQWVGTQPVHVREMYNRNAETFVDGQEASHLVTLYKTSENYVAPPAPAPDPDPAPAPATEIEPENSPAPAPIPATGGGPNKRERDLAARLEGNTALPTGGPGTVTGVPEDFDGAFDEFSAQADRARANVAKG